MSRKKKCTKFLSFPAMVSPQSTYVLKYLHNLYKFIVSKFNKKKSRVTSGLYREVANKLLQQLHRNRGCNERTGINLVFYAVFHKMRACLRTLASETLKNVSMSRKSSFACTAVINNPGGELLSKFVR